MAKSTALAKADTASTAVAPNYDYGTYGSEGFESKGMQDISLPFLNVLQPLSPQVADGVIEGAKAGLYFNTVTNELAETVDFVWAYDEIKYVEWIPRDAGGGIAGVHDLDSDVVKKAKAAAGARSNKLKVGTNDLVETRYIYGLTLNPDGTVAGFAVIAAKSTNLKPARDWRTSMMMAGRNIPIFAYRTTLSTVKEKNDKGTWFKLQAKPYGGNWKTTALIDPASGVLAEAKNLRDMIVAGTAKADYAAQAESGDHGASEAADGTAPF